MNDEKTGNSGEETIYEGGNGHDGSTTGGDDLSVDLDAPEGQRSEGEGAARSEDLVQEMAADLAAARSEASDFKDKYLRSLAEFENYKKRALKERSDLIKYQGEKIFSDILEVVDNLELALNYGGADAAKVREGLELIHKRFLEILGRWDVRGQSAIGKDFDPNMHNAISRVMVDDAKPGTVINELKKTYFYKDKLLRFGEVVVAEARGEEK
jgi:molecular chaperone GrpE